jgi:hypothetical protein
VNGLSVVSVVVELFSELVINVLVDRVGDDVHVVAKHSRSLGVSFELFFGTLSRNDCCCSVMMLCTRGGQRTECRKAINNSHASGHSG